MSFFGKIYRQNIYGVMGTLVFHILIFTTFIIADVDKKGNVKEEQILIEFPDDLPEVEEPDEMNEDEQESEAENDNREPNTRTNVASNRLATENITTSADEFFDDDYLREVEAAKQLRSDVSDQISKKIVDIEDMPVVTPDVQERDSIKNIIYVGESNIVYYLENRFHVRLANPLYLAQGGGKVVVDIVVDKQGRVIQAVPQKSRSVRDEQIYRYAKAAALQTIFNADDNAPDEQPGTIQYTFIAQ